MPKKNDRLVPPSEIARDLEVHSSSVPRIFAADADAPKPVQIGCRKKYWESELCTYYKKKGIA